MIQRIFKETVKWWTTVVFTCENARRPL